MAIVKIPTPLRSYTQNAPEVTIEGATVGAVLKSLDQKHPGIGTKLFDEKGGLRRYINVFHNDEDIRFLKDLDTEIADKDTLSIIPAIAGG